MIVADPRSTSPWRIALALLLDIAACGHAPTPQEQWFADRGRASPTWHTCLRMAAELRHACDDDTACATRVTRDLSRPCYAARYDQEASHSTPRDDVRVERLSPCFWDRAPSPAASPAGYADATCHAVVDARLHAACTAELREVIDVVCAAGAPDLTGAGP